MAARTEVEIPVADDLDTFIELCRRYDACVDIDGVAWDLELGTLTEAAADLIPDPPMLLFDNIPGYPAGFRVLSLPLSTHQRAAIALGLNPKGTKLELVRQAARLIKNAPMIPPAYVETGPILENRFTGDDVDLTRLPVPRYHEDDGGRYIGTGDVVIQRDAEGGFINAGTYRIQVHEPNLLGLWISPGQHGRMIFQQYWSKGESCPVVATFGGDPLTFMASHTKLPWGQSELDLVGGLRGRPLEVIKGPITGLPIPAHAEIAIEGEIPPPAVELRAEGPFGEWPGYYSGGTPGTGELQPVIRVKALYHRNNPIILNVAPMWPGAAPLVGLSMRSGVLWDQLEGAGIQDVVGVYSHTSYLVVVAIKQRYAGHAQQAGMAALACAAEARHGRYVVIVDEDIDPTDLKEVLWAMETRVDPASDIQVIDGTWSTPLDPMMSPAKREARDYTNSRAIFYAVRPFGWKDEFPPVSRSSKDQRAKVIEKYKSLLPFPR